MTEFEYHNAGNDEAKERQALAYLFAQSSVGVAATGVLVGLNVTQTATASSAVLVGAGACVAQQNSTSGASLLPNDTNPKTLDVLTANPVGGLPRNDIVVFDAATTSVRAIIGTPNVTPTDPAVPSTCALLARLRHAASATTIPTAKIDDVRAFTRLAGVSAPAALYTRTTDYTLTTGAESPTLASVTPPPSSTGVRVVLYVPAIFSTTASDRIVIRLRDGSGAQIGGGYVIPATAAANCTVVYGYIAAGGSTGVITMTAQRVGGSGSVTLRGVEGWTLEASAL